MLPKTRKCAILLQFEDAAATKLSRKKGFGVAFCLQTFIPILMMISYFTWLGYLGIEWNEMTVLLTYFSPLSIWDVLFLYTIGGSASIIPFILYKSYNGMEARLTKYAQVYSQVMHGKLHKGITCILRYAI